MVNPYVSMTWEDRNTEFPNRRLLTNTQDQTDVKQVYVERDEGQESGGQYKTGTPLTAETFNNLEGRINNAFAAMSVAFEETLNGTTDPDVATGKNGDIYFKTETVDNVTSIVGMFVKIANTWFSVATGGAQLPQAEGSEF